MKKNIIIALTLIMAVALTSCTDASSQVSKTSSAPNSKSASAPQSTSTSQSAAASVASEPAKDGDVVAALGETLDYDGLKITLTSVKKFEDTSKFAVNKAEEGKMYVLLYFSVSNETGEDAVLNMFYEDSYCDDTAIDPEAIMINVEGDSLWGNLANGKKKEGYIGYQVPENWQTIDFYYNPVVLGGSSSKMMFRANVSDMA